MITKFLRYIVALISVLAVVGHVQAATTASTFALSSSSYSTSQTKDTVTIYVARTGSTNKAASVSYSTVDGTAKAGTDYTSSKGTLRWEAGDKETKRFWVRLSKGTPFSGSKAFKVALSNPSSGNTLGTPNSATVTVAGSGATTAGTVALSATSYTASVDSGSVAIAVKRSGSTGTAKVSYATSNGTGVAGSDYVATSGTLSWASGDTSSKTIRVPIVSLSSSSKTFKVALSSPSGATLGSPNNATVTIKPNATWTAEAWSSRYQSPEKSDQLWSKTGTLTAGNGAVYYGRMNAWNFGASGFRSQKVWINSERDWGITSNHVNDGQVKSYSSIVRGWALGEGFNGIKNSGLGIQVSALTKVKLRWAFNAPSEYGGVAGANATNRVNVLWDTYFHTTPNPGANDNPHTSLMINQYDVDGDGYYGGLAKNGQAVTLGGRQWKMHVHKSAWATGNTIELFPEPYNDYKVFGTKDLTLDYLAVVKDLVRMGLIPTTDYLTSIQAGYEIIAGGVFQTTDFWTAVQGEADGTPSGGNSSGGGDSSGGGNTVDAPTVNLSATSTSISSGQSTTLSWSTTNANACTASGAWAGAQATSGSKSTGALTKTSTFTLTCTGTGGSASASKTVTVSSATAPAPTVTLKASPTSVTSGGSSTLTWSSTNATSCTASGSWSGTQTTSGSSSTGGLTKNGTYQLTCTGAGGSATASVTVSVSTSSTAGSCAGNSSGTYWVYYNGQFNWPYDYSWGGLTLNYKDTSGAPLSGSYDIKATGPVYAGWQPAALNWSFDITGCKYLTFALKPTRANQSWHSAFLYVNDVPTGITLQVNVSKYGPATPVVGQWNVYKIPLADYFPGGVVPKDIYKFFIQDTTDFGTTNTWYIDNVGLTSN